MPIVCLFCSEQIPSNRVGDKQRHFSQPPCPEKGAGRRHVLILFMRERAREEFSRCP